MINKFGFDNPINEENSKIDNNNVNKLEVQLKELNESSKVNENEVNVNKNYLIDNDKIFSCFDKVKNHMLIIHEKYLFPLVLREDNFKEEVKVKVKMNNTNSNNNDVNKQGSDEIKLSEIASRLDDLNNNNESNNL